MMSMTKIWHTPVCAFFLASQLAIVHIKINGCTYFMNTQKK